MKDFKITKEMNIRTARNIYNEIKIVKNCMIESYCNEFVSVETLLEKIGYTLSCCVSSILAELEIEDNDYTFGIVLNCIEDDDTFEYMMKSLEFGKKNASMY